MPLKFPTPKAGQHEPFDAHVNSPLTPASIQEFYACLEAPCETSIQLLNTVILARRRREKIALWEDLLSGFQW